MASGFKGTKCEISSITLIGNTPAGAEITFGVQFVDDKGLVHASTQHRLSVGQSPDIRDASKTLHAALVEWTEKAHFETTSTAPKATVLHGIAETLRGSSDPTDDPEDQG